jgi:hypothetical protein
MNRKLATIIGLQALLIVILFWVLVFYGKDEYEAYTREQAEEIEAPSHVGNELGATLVTLSAAMQQQSEIQTTKLQAGVAQQTLKSLGNVLSIDTLIEQRSQYLNAKAEATISRASLTNSQQEFQRLSTLNQDDHNVSDRAVTAAQAAFKADQAKAQAAETQASNIQNNMRQTWGEMLTKLAVQTSTNASFENLLQHKELLVQVVIPFDHDRGAAPDMLTISPSSGSNTHSNIQAKLVSGAPKADSTVQGETYFYRASASNLRVGMRVGVQLPNKPSKEDALGVIIPNSAVVWYGGKAWVFQKKTAEKFLRLPIETNKEVTGGWLNGAKFKIDDEIVISGAQLLLSEEFKSQIKNENED